MNGNIPLLVGMAVVAELLRKLSHAEGVSPRDATTVPEGNVNDNAYALVQQLPNPPTLPLQQPES